VYTESAEYQYLKKLDGAKAWFRGNVEQIMNVYGREHNIQKEDLFLGEWTNLERDVVQI
jgi:viroplasmin and RNaseH domain-containing protein